MVCSSYAWQKQRPTQRRDSTLVVQSGPWESKFCAWVRVYCMNCMQQFCPFSALNASMIIHGHCVRLRYIERSWNMLVSLMIEYGKYDQNMQIDQQLSKWGHTSGKRKIRQGVTKCCHLELHLNIIWTSKAFENHTWQCDSFEQLCLKQGTQPKSGL